MQVASHFPGGPWMRYLIMITCMIVSLCTTAVSALPSPQQNVNVNVQSGQSIQAAIDAAQSGTQITVEAGIYAEHLTITTDSITLIGEGAVLVPPNEHPQNICYDIAGNQTNAGICIQGADVELAPFEAEHRKVTSVGQPVSNVSISGFTISGFDGENIAVIGGSNVQITNNALLNGGHYGILAAGSENTVITDNAVVSDGEGEFPLGFIAICTDDRAPAQVHRNRVSGYYVGLCIQTSGSELTANHISDVCVGASIDPAIEDAQVLHNYFGPTNPSCLGTTPFIGGIFVYGAVNGVVAFNVVEGQQANGSVPGIALIDALEISPDFVASGNTIARNVLRENDFDLFVNSTGSGNTVVGNVCSTPSELCGGA